MNIINAFSVNFKVRDYECDLQGIVNNAVYMHYLEHARHEYLAHLGLDFKALFDRGISLVVTRVEIQYRRSLRSGDAFVVTCQPVFESKCKVKFLQDIEKGEGEKMTQAVVTVAAIDSNRKPILINSIFSL